MPIASDGVSMTTQRGAAWCAGWQLVEESRDGNGPTDHWVHDDCVTVDDVLHRIEEDDQIDANPAERTVRSALNEMAEMGRVTAVRSNPTLYKPVEDDSPAANPTRDTDDDGRADGADDDDVDGVDTEAVVVAREKVAGAPELPARTEGFLAVVEAVRDREFLYEDSLGELYRRESAAFQSDAAYRASMGPALDELAERREEIERADEGWRWQPADAEDTRSFTALKELQS